MYLWLGNYHWILGQVTDAIVIGLHFTKVFLKCKLFNQHTLRNPLWRSNGSVFCRFNHCMIMGDFCLNVKPRSSELEYISLLRKVAEIISLNYLVFSLQRGREIVFPWKKWANCALLSFPLRLRSNAEADWYAYTGPLHWGPMREVNEENNWNQTNLS